MPGTPFKALAKAQFQLDQLLGGHQRGSVSPKKALEFADQLFAFSDALGQSPQLAQFCIEQTYSAAAKKQLLERLLSHNLDPEVIEELAQLSRERWSSGDGLRNAVESLGVRCVISAIGAERRARAVEFQLFQLATAMASNPEASAFLSNSDVPVEIRRKMVVRLLGGKADPLTVLLAERATTRPTSGRFRATLNQMVTLIAASRDFAVAKVTSPVELSEAQVKRLEHLLSRKYGQDIEVNVSVEPSVIGGLRVEIGDRVLDQTVSTRLYDAERYFSGAAGSGAPGRVTVFDPVNADSTAMSNSRSGS